MRQTLHFVIIILSLSVLANGCSSYEPCDCVESIYNQVTEHREISEFNFMTFDLGDTEICRQLEKGLNQEELIELREKMKSCAMMVKLDSIEVLRESESNYFTDSLNINYE